MTPEDVMNAISEIATDLDETGDNEQAHVDEDELHQNVLEAIAEGAEHPKELAALALTTRAIKFERWYI